MQIFIIRQQIKFYRLRRIYIMVLHLYEKSKYHLYIFLKIKDKTKESLYSTKINRQQDISPITIFIFVNLKNELLAFLGWPYYILERLTIL